MYFVWLSQKRSINLRLTNNEKLYSFNSLNSSRQDVGSHKNINTINTKHISSPTFHTCLRQVTWKCLCFQTSYCNCNNTTIYLTVFHFRHNSLIITLYCSYCIYSSISQDPKPQRKLSDYLHRKMLFIDFQGSLKETFAQRLPCI